MEEYTELNNLTSVNNGEIWDEGASFPVYFDFDFSIFDQTYSSINIMAGGIVFPGFGYRAIRAFHTPFGGYLLRDKGTINSVSSIDYEVTGEEGQYVIKVQWKNAGFIQWYPTSDTADYVNFQIWIFQEDGHLELHFGSSQTDPGTYGYPDSTSDPDPGPSIVFVYTSCDSVFCYFNDADNPSYDYFNWCTPNQSFVDGTPSEGITYTITPNPNYTGLPQFNQEHISTFPNPAIDYIRIEAISNLSEIVSISILSIHGNTLQEIQDFDTSESNICIDVRNLPAGMYLIKINSNKKSIIKKFIKKCI